MNQHITSPNDPMKPGNPDADSTSSGLRTGIGVLAVAALGLASAGLIITQLGDSNDELSGSLNGVPYALAQAVDDAEADRAASEVIQLTSISDTITEDEADDNVVPGIDEVADTVGDIASTVGDKLIEVGKCVLDWLPDVFSESTGTDTVEPADIDDVAPCSDLLPNAGDFGGIDLEVFDLADIDLDTLDLGDLDPSDLGLPADFDLGDIDLGELGDFELPDLGDLDATDLDLSEIDFGTEVLEVVSDVADDIVEFFEELPGDLSDRFDSLFGD